MIGRGRPAAALFLFEQNDVWGGIFMDVAALLELDWHSKPSFTVSGRTLVAAEALLLGYLHHIFEKPLKSLEFIRQIG